MATRRGTIVLTNGIFDLLHEGHLSLLEFARAQGDWLVVALNSDSSTRQLKGPGRPAQDEATRRAALEALPFVDEVIIFDSLRPADLIAEVRPHVIVKGAEYSAEKVRGDDSVPDSVSIVLAPILRGESGEKISTSNLLADQEG